MVKFAGRPIYVSWAVPKHQYNGEQNGSPTKKRQTSGSSDDVKVEVKGRQIYNLYTV